MARSPSVAKPGATMPRTVRSKPMRPTWIANRVAMKPRTQPRSIDARADSSSASRRARARTSGSSGSSRSATAVSPAVAGGEHGGEEDAHGRPEDPRRGGGGHRPRHHRLPAEYQQRPADQEVAEAGGDPGQGGPAGVPAEERAGELADAVQAEPAGEEEDDRRGGEVGGVDQQDAHGQRDRAPEPRRPPPGLGRAAEAVHQLQHGGEDQQQPDPPLDLDPRQWCQQCQRAQAQGDHPQPVAPPRGVPRRRPGPAGPLVLESSWLHRRGHRVPRVPASIPRCAFCAPRRDVGASSTPTPVRTACPEGRVATGVTPGRNECRARILTGRRRRGNRPRRPSPGRRRHRPE